MRILAFSLRNLMRDWRSGELQLIMLATFVAVASITTVGFFTDRIQRFTLQQANELLAADRVLRSSSPLAEDLIEQARSAGLQTTRTVSLRSVVAAGDRLELAALKAIEDGYPIRGRLKIADALFAAEYETDTIPARGTVWVDPRMFQNLGVNMDDTIEIGAGHFQVTRIVTYEPDRGGDLFNIAPRIIMNLADLEATQLLLPGSRARFKLLLGGDLAALDAFQESAEIAARPDLRIEDIREARPELESALDRAEQFLGLAVLISIALAGLAIAMSAQRYVVRHFDHCAIMRCLGTEQNSILQIFFCQLLVLALAAALAGCLAAFAAQEVLAVFMSELTMRQLPPPGLFPVAQGLMAGIICVTGFATPQLLRLRHVSPMRVLRRDLTPVNTRGWITYGLAIGALSLLTPWQSGSVKLTFYVLAGLAITAVLLVLSARLLISIAGRQRGRVGIAMRYGLANIARHAAQSTLQILGIGLGIMVMLLLTLVRTDLLDSWRKQLPDGTPNYFLINIQPDQVNDIETFLQKKTGVASEFYPMVRGRLTAINARPNKAKDYTDERSQRLATREFNLSWADTMQVDNRLVQGEWWDGTETGTLFSVEEGIAERLGIRTGDSLTYYIAGKTITGEVVNLREVEWDSFNVNFFVVANATALTEFPATYITSFYLPDENRPVLSELVKTFPSVTVFDVAAVLKQVRIIMDQVIKTIEFVFTFTLLAGIIVLIAAIQTTHDERIRESALLFTLGASSRQVRAGLVTEFACLGLIAGFLAALAASIAGALLAHFVFQMDITVHPLLWIVAPIVCTVLIVAAGLLGTRQVMHTPPLQSLRQG